MFGAISCILYFSLKTLTVNPNLSINPKAGTILKAQPTKAFHLDRILYIYHYCTHSKDCSTVTSILTVTVSFTAKSLAHY